MKDSFGREITYLRLSVTDRCNLRCRYCMPESGIFKKNHEEMLTEDEMIAAVEAAADLGVTKLRITGGEPLVKKNILSICRRAADIPGIQEFCMTTNGTLLPIMAKKLKHAGVNRLNISLDTLNPEKYRHMTRIGTLSEALLGIDAAFAAGFDKIKINCVLIGGFNDDEIPALAELTKDRPISLRFIELMPMVEQNAFGPESFISNTAVLSALPELQKLPDDHGVASLYRLPNALGTVGLISPVTCSFCNRCNRLRITADGMIKPCLHTRAEISLKGLSKSEMKAALEQAILMKAKNHDDLSYGHSSQAMRQMNTIGG